MKRRDFGKICASMAATAVAGGPPVALASQRESYPLSGLHTENHQTVTGETLEPGVPYVFFYPYISTPCFLIDLDTEARSGPTHHDPRTGEPYTWLGGVGPNSSIVAFSAICSHKMSHPAREISFINYRHDAVSFYSNAGKSEKKQRVISCCSERSVYDPADGARVLGGPAPQPLAAIELSYDNNTGAISAAASYGGDMYDRFFEKFGFRAAIEHKVNDPAELVGSKTLVRKLTDYSRQTIKC